jgi:hypothetical protein
VHDLSERGNSNQLVSIKFKASKSLSNFSTPTAQEKPGSLSITCARVTFLAGWFCKEVGFGERDGEWIFKSSVARERTHSAPDCIGNPEGYLRKTDKKWRWNEGGDSETEKKISHAHRHKSLDSRSYI